MSQIDNPEFWQWIERISWIASIIIGIGAIALTIFLSGQETRIQNFADLLEKNTKIVGLLSEQNAEDIRIRSIERKTNWSRLRKTALDITEIFLFRQIERKFNELIVDEKIKWIEATVLLLERKLHNPLSLENDSLYTKWFNLHTYGI